MLKPKYAKKFKKDLKRLEHQKPLMREIRSVIECLLAQKKLEEKYLDHPLMGNWVDHRECHIKPDLLLIYKIGTDTLFLERLGSHSELFS
jgi:mRNA interferase YafQ